MDISKNLLKLVDEYLNFSFYKLKTYTAVLNIYISLKKSYLQGAYIGQICLQKSDI